MTPKTKSVKTEANTTTQQRRQNDGGTYLIVADDTPEFTVALNYAVHMARLHRGHVAMAKIVEPVEFTGWSAIHGAAKAEGREEAEAALLALASTVSEQSGVLPTFLIREGNPVDVIVSVVKGNPAISALVLAASTTTGKPGPLITHFASKGLAQLSVPVILVPGHMKESELEKLL